MTIDKLIEEYKEMTSICNQIDYSYKKAVNKNNKAVDKMYQIVNTINSEFGENGFREFSKLIDITKDKTNLWASVHMLEKMQVDNLIEQKALEIIKEEAKDSIGMEYWLKQYN